MRRGFVLAFLLVTIAACGGLSFVTDMLRTTNLRSLGEVTAVVDGERPGTVTVHRRWRDDTTSWLVDDNGDVLERVGAADDAKGAARVRQCAGTTCYRAATTALRVEVSDDGGRTYATAWEVAGDAYAMLAKSYPDVGDPAEHLSSRSLATHPVAGGHVVFVANGRDGLLYRDVRGAWRRLGFPASGEGCCFYESALPIGANPRPVILTAVAVVVGVVATLLPAAVIAARRRTARWTDVAAVVVLAALAGYGSALAVRFPGVGMFPGWLYGLPVMLAIVVGGAALGALFGNAPRPPRHG